MICIALILVLSPEPNIRLDIEHGVYAHAAILHTLTTVDSRVARMLHDAKRNKPFTIAFIPQTHTTLLRIAFIGDTALAYSQLLIRALSQHNSLRIGPTSCVIEHIDLHHTTWTGAATWSDLCKKDLHTSLHFDFVTPSAITQRNDQGSRITLLYPDPVTVFRGLARRWRSLHGPALPADIDQFVESGGCVVSRYDLQTTQFKTQERTQLAFIGNITYLCLQNSAPHVAALNALTRLAFFVGIGYQVSRGMGFVRTSTTN